MSHGKKKFLVAIVDGIMFISIEVSTCKLSGSSQVDASGLIWPLLSVIPDLPDMNESQS